MKYVQCVHLSYAGLWQGAWGDISTEVVFVPCAHLCECEEDTEKLFSEELRK